MSAFLGGGARGRMSYLASRAPGLAVDKEEDDGHEHQDTTAADHQDDQGRCPDCPVQAIPEKRNGLINYRVLMSASSFCTQNELHGQGQCNDCAHPANTKKPSYCGSPDSNVINTHVKTLLFCVKRPGTDVVGLKT